MTKDLKEFYTGYADNINAKRLYSEYGVRRYAHFCQYSSVLAQVKLGDRVLDAGCGEGSLSVMLAKKGAIVVGTDISEPNIVAARAYAEQNGVDITFHVADIENLPFETNTFDVVVSSHVLEHIPDFDKGLHEIVRVSKAKVVVAIPTILNLCSFVQVGGGHYYLKGLRSFRNFFYGFLLMFGALVMGKEGVDEGYAGNGVVHIFRFPWIFRKKLLRYNYTLVKQEASSLCIPFFEFLIPLSKMLDKFKHLPILREFGYGTTYVIKK